MKVSVIVPVYNVAPYIERCLMSVLNQSYKDLECILVNDCTPDNSMKIVEELLLKHPRKTMVHIVNHAENQGLSGARNSGVKAAKGEYIYFLDSDDALYPDAIAGLVREIEEKGPADFVIGPMEVRGSSLVYPLVKDQRIVEDTQIFTDYVRGKWYVMACGKLINHLFFIRNKLWFGEHLLHEDELFAFRLAVCSRKMIYYHAPNYIYYWRKSGSITSSGSIRHCRDYGLIVARNFQLIRKTFKPASGLPVYDYIISTVYSSFMKMDEIRNTELSASRDIALLSRRMKKLLRCMAIYKQYENKNIRLKAYILACPVEVIFKIIHVYRRLLKVC